MISNFPFAQEAWSIFVCDEAQKIKNPNAMVTHAARKLNVRFRVACTGPPVENNADRQLGWEAVRDVVGGTAIYAEQFPAIRFRRLAITNQTFNERAHERARANSVELIEQSRLAQLIVEHPISAMDVLVIRSTPRL